MNLQPEKDFDFMKTTKTAIASNKLAKFLVVGGAACSVVNGFFSKFAVTSLVESFGIGTAAWIASQSLKRGQSMSSMSNEQVNKHLTKGAFLAIGGAVLGGLTHILPGTGLEHVAQYPTSILFAAGVIAVAEAGYQKIKRPKI